MNITNTRTASIESKDDFEQQIVETGVVVDGELLHTKGEGRGRRYFRGTDNVPKDEVVGAFDGEGDYEIPEPGHEHGDITCQVCGDAVGYLTGSHMKTHADDEPQTVDAYRAFVAEQEGIEPEEVPLATDQLMDLFRSAGDLDESTRQELSERNKARWEAGEYEHLRKDDEAEDDEADEEAIPA